MLKNYCINILKDDLEKYGKPKNYPKSLLAANIFLWQKQKNTIDVEPTADQLAEFEKELEKSKISRDIRNIIQTHSISLDKEKHNLDRDLFIFNINDADVAEILSLAPALQKVNLREEAANSLERENQADADFPTLQARVDSAEYVYREFRDLIQKYKAATGINNTAHVLESIPGNVTSVFNEIKLNIYKRIVKYSSPEFKSQLIANLQYRDGSSVEDATALANRNMQKMINNLVNICNNFTVVCQDACNKIAFSERVHIHINADNTMDMVEQNISEQDDTNSDTVQNTEDVQKEKWQTKFAEDSTKAGLSRTVRLMIHDIPEKDQFGRVQRDRFGRVRYIDADQVHAILLSQLMPMTHPHELIPMLKDMAKDYPWADDIVKMIEIGPNMSAEQIHEAEQKFTALYVDMCGSYSEYIVELLSQNEDGTFTLKTKNLNKLEVFDYLFDKWRGNYMRRNISKPSYSVYDFDGALSAENAQRVADKASELKSQYLAYFGEEYKVQGEWTKMSQEALDRGMDAMNEKDENIHTLATWICYLLNGVAVDVSVERMEQIIQSAHIETKEDAKGNQISKAVHPAITLLNNIHSIASTISNKANDLNKQIAGNVSEQSEFDLINQFGKEYAQIAYHLKSTVEGVVEANFREGDLTRYAHSMDNELMRLYRMIKYGKQKLTNEGRNMLDAVLQEQFKQYEWYWDEEKQRYNIELLNQIAGILEDGSYDAEAQDRFLDSQFELKTVLAQDKKETDQWDEKETLISMIAEYNAFEFEDEDSDKKYAKSGFARYHLPLSADAPIAYLMTLKKHTKAELVDLFVPVVKQEYERIMQVRDRQTSATSTDRIANKDDESIGGTFRFLNTLNKRNDEGEIIVLELIKNAKEHPDDQNLENELKQVISDAMDELAAQDLEYFHQIGIDETTDNGVGKYVKASNTVKTLASDLRGVAMYAFEELDKQPMDVKNLILRDLLERLAPLQNVFVMPTDFSSRLKMHKDANYTGVDASMIQSVIDYLRPYAEAGIARENAENRKKGVSETLMTTYDSLLSESIDDKLRNMSYNYMYAMTEMIQFVSGDPANYKNLADYVKRGKEKHAPGRRLNTKATWHGDPVSSNNGRQNVMFVEDRKYASSIMEDIKTTSRANGLTEDEASFIAGMYNDVNMTDGQTLRSLKSYREIAIMSDHEHWSDAIEESYRRIIGDSKEPWTFKDFTNVLNAIKPYCSTNLSYKWTDSAGVEHNWKHHIQIKTSDAPLLTMYATISNVGNNRLKILNDAMQKNNIDAIVFVSAVKVGGQGVVNLDVDKNEQRIPDDQLAKVFDDAVQKPNVVHSISLDDYVIQQEEREHLLDAMQLIGSQLQKLLFADTPDDTPISVPEWMYKVMYPQYDTEFVQVEKMAYTENGEHAISFGDLRHFFYSLLTENKVTSAQDLYQRFGDIKSVEKMLISQARNSAVFSPDLIKACTLEPVYDASGNFVQYQFNIPVDDPIQKNKIQALFYSIIKNDVVKQKFPGGTCVQMSNYSYDKDLNVRFYNKAHQLVLTEQEFEDSTNAKKKYKTYAAYKASEEGKGVRVAYAECYITCYDSSIIEWLQRNNIGADGIINIETIKKVNPEVGDKLSKLIGYRIPTEDKFSMIPLKIKGFLPGNMGSSIMLPAEWTTISGSDFDIDHLYIMAQRMSIEDKDLLFEEYDYGVLPLANSTEQRNQAIFDVVYSVLTSQGVSAAMLNPGGTRQLTSSANLIRILKYCTSDEQKEIAKELGVKLIDLPDALQKLSDKELENYYKKYHTEDSFVSMNSWIKNRVRIVSSSQMIGLFANQNVNHALLQQCQARLDDSYTFTVDGFTFDNLSAIMDAESQMNKDRHVTISRNNSEYIDSAVDDVKNPKLWDLNLNMFTGDVAMTYSRLGASPKMVAALLNQPIVMDMVNMYNSENGMTKDEIIERVIEKYGGNVAQEILAHWKPQSIKGYNFSTREFLQNFALETYAHERPDETDFGETPNFSLYLARQMKAGLLFMHLYGISKDLAEVISIGRTDTTNGAAGPSVADTNKIIVTTKSWYQKQNPAIIIPKYIDPYILVDNEINLANATDADWAKIRMDIYRSPIPSTQASYTLGIEATENVLKDYFPEYNDVFISPDNGIIQQMRDLTKTGRLSTKLEKLIYRDAIYYYIANYKDSSGLTMYDTYTDSNNRVFRTGEKSPLDGHILTRKDLMYMWINDFPQKVLTMKKLYDDLNLNIFSKRLWTAQKNKRCPVDKVIFKNVGHLNNETKYIIAQGWDYLLKYTSPKGDDAMTQKIRTLGKELFIYAGMRTGFDFGPDTYIHLANVAVRKKASPHYIEALRKATDAARFISDPHEFIELFLRNHLDERALVPEIDALSNFSSQGKMLETASIPIALTTRDSKIRKVKISRDGGFHKYIAIRSNKDIYYYMFTGISDEHVNYVRVDPIGVRNNLLVYTRFDENDINETLEQGATVTKATSQQAPTIVSKGQVAAARSIDSSGLEGLRKRNSENIVLINDVVENVNGVPMGYWNPFEKNATTTNTEVYSIGTKQNLYKSWLYGEKELEGVNLEEIEPERRAWIQARVLSGELDGKLLYDTIKRTNDGKTIRGSSAETLATYVNDMRMSRLNKVLEWGDRRISDKALSTNPQYLFIYPENMTGDLYLSGVLPVNSKKDKKDNTMPFVSARTNNGDRQRGVVNEDLRYITQDINPDIYREFRTMVRQSVDDIVKKFQEGRFTNVVLPQNFMNAERDAYWANVKKSSPNAFAFLQREFGRMFDMINGSAYIESEMEDIDKVTDEERVEADKQTVNNNEKPSLFSQVFPAVRKPDATGKYPC